MFDPGAEATAVELENECCEIKKGCCAISCDDLLKSTNMKCPAGYAIKHRHTLSDPDSKTTEDITRTCCYKINNCANELHLRGLVDSDINIDECRDAGYGRAPRSEYMLPSAQHTLITSCV